MENKQTYINNDNIKIEHTFKNEYWEEYIIYTLKLYKGYYITGDELDWESGYVVNSWWLIFKPFLSNEWEQKEIIKFFKNK